MNNSIVQYVRVSTNNQEYFRQINELDTYAKSQNLNIAKTFHEKISGNKLNEDRKQLIEMIDYCLINNIPRINILSLDRIGRNTLEVLKTIEILNNNKISLYIHNLGIETLTPSKEINPTTKIMVTMLAEFSSIERTQIRERMRSGYRNYIDNGNKVGRHKGQVKKTSVLKEDHKDIIKYLKQGQSIRNTAKLTGKSTPTVMKIKKLFIDAA